MNPQGPVVVHMTSAHPPDDIRIFVKECRTLAAAGYQVHLIVPGAGAGERDGVHMHDPGAARAGRLGRMLVTIGRMYAMARKLNAEIYHLHDPELLPVGGLLLAAGRRVVYDAHEHLPLMIMATTWLPRMLRSPVARIADFLERLAARRVTAVITAGPPVCERFRSVACRQISIYNYPRPEEFCGPSSDRLAGRRAVCYVGVITEMRGVRQMIEAAALAEVELILAGHFSPSKLIDELRGEPGWRRVHWLGRVGRAEVRAVIGESLAGLCLTWPPASDSPGQPTKVYEYMWAGTPVIASAFPAWRAILETHACGLCVDPLNVRAVANAILFLAKNPEEARRMGDRGRVTAKRLFSWNTEAGKLLDLYREILSQQAHRPASATL